MKFREFCKSQGIELLYDDLKFVNECIGRLRPKEKHEALKSYCRIWTSHIKNQKGGQNNGRREANIFLREFVTKQKIGDFHE